MISLELRVRFERWRLRRAEAAWNEARSRPMTGEQLDWWVLHLGEARWRAQRAEADFKNGSRWADRHERSKGR